MRFSLKTFIIPLITSLCAVSVASAVNVSYGQKTVDGVQTNGHTAQVAETQTVTLDAKLDTPSDVERAVEIATALIDGTPADHITLLEATNSEEPLSLSNDNLLETLRSRVESKRQKTIQFTKEALKNLSDRATRAGIATGKSASGAVRDPHRLSIMIVRFVSASAATYVGVSLAAGLPMNVTEYWNMLGQTWQTGAMSAAMVMFVDLYSDIIVNPGFLSKHVDESKWMRAVVRKFRKPHRSKTSGDEGLPFKIGLYTDQILKSLSMEFVFVFGSTWATAGLVPAAEALPHIFTGAINGGLGQTFLDQAITILVRARTIAIEAKYPAGPQREAKLKRLMRYRDVGMAANSLAQVWLVMIATRGNTFAQAALHFYLGAGIIVRAAVIPVENRLNKKKPASNFEAPSRSLRCESLFASA